MVYDWQCICKLVTNEVPEGSILGLLLFSIVINDVQEEMEYTLTMFADDTKQRGQPICSRAELPFRGT